MRVFRTGPVFASSWTFSPDYYSSQPSPTTIEHARKKGEEERDTLPLEELEDIENHDKLWTSTDAYWRENITMGQRSMKSRLREPPRKALCSVRSEEPLAPLLAGMMANAAFNDAAQNSIAI